MNTSKTNILAEFISETISHCLVLFGKQLQLGAPCNVTNFRSMANQFSVELSNIYGKGQSNSLQLFQFLHLYNLMPHTAFTYFRSVYN